MSRNSFQGLSSSGFHRVSYTEWGDPGSAHIVICVHGLTRNARDFDALARSLEHRCRVVCPDIVGRGQSGWLARKADYNYSQYLADMTALMARVTARTDAGTCIDWVGTSMGGIIGMLLAAKTGSPLRRLAINDIGPRIPKEAMQRIASYVGRPTHFRSFAEAETYVRTVSASFGPLTNDQWRHLTEHNCRQQADGTWTMNYDPGIAEVFGDAALSDVSLWEHWDRIKAPVLVTRGKHSDVLLAATALEMTRRGPKARLIEFAGVGHAPMLMADDQIRAVHDFLFAP